MPFGPSGSWTAADALAAEMGVRLIAIVVALVVCLLAPVLYVEFACKGDRIAQPYTAILPPDHHRSEARTLLTYPEWHIVHAYDDYAQVIKEGDPHDFGYLKAVRTYWSSLCALKKRSVAHGGWIRRPSSWCMSSERVSALNWH
ncbi:hypothetical protein ACFQD0_20100 [Sulfitobacter aestuariivivens]